MERLTGLDAAFLVIERERYPLNVHALAVLDPSDFDGTWDFAHFSRVVKARIAVQPWCRRRLKEPSIRLDHPVWVVDPHVDMLHHMRHVVAPPPGDAAALDDVVARIVAGRLDRRRPLWQAWFVEGLADGRVAVLFKVHHAVVDGVAGMEQLAQFLDLDPAAGLGDAEASASDPTAATAAEPSRLELTADALARLRRRPVEVARLMRRSVSALAGLAQTRLKRDADERRVLAHAMAAPPTSLNESVGLDRRFCRVRLPLNRVKAVKNAAGTTVNDVLLALCGGALRDYLAAHGDVPRRSLVAGVPVSAHATDEDGLHNRVTAMWVYLGTHLADPRERLSYVHASAAAAKGELAHLGSDLLEQWAEQVPPQVLNGMTQLLLRSGLHRRRPLYNVTVSNVPGPRVPLYLGGARVESLIPVGPIFEGVGLNITVFSYLDAIDVGLLADAATIADVATIARRLPEQLAALEAALGC